MNHPNQEEWVSYLDGEISPEVKRRLSEHLMQCSQCAAEIDGWQRSIRKIQRLPFPRTEKALRARQTAWNWTMPALKWGIAAAFILVVGFAFGRLSSADANQIQNEVTKKVRQQIRTELEADLLAASGPRNREAQS